MATHCFVQLSKKYRLNSPLSPAYATAYCWAPFPKSFQREVASDMGEFFEKFSPASADYKLNKERKMKKIEINDKIIVIDENTIRVNVERTPDRFFWRAISQDPWDLEFYRLGTEARDKWVEVKKEDGRLLINDREVNLLTTPAGLFTEQVEAKADQWLSQSPNILDALLEHQNLIPENWKKETDTAIFFLGTIFKLEIPGSRWPLPPAYENIYRCIVFVHSELYNPRQIWKKSYIRHCWKLETHMTVACIK